MPKPDNFVPFFYGDKIMHANFNLKREIANELTCGRTSAHNTYLNFHSHIEIYLVLSGEIEVIINDKRKVLRGGELSVALCYDAHGYRAVSDAEAIYLIIPTGMCQEFLALSQDRRTPSPFINDRTTYETVLCAMNVLLDKSRNELSRRGAVCTILGAILDRMTLEGSSSEPQHTFSTEILIYVSEHFAEELTLDMLAKKFGYNPSYLSRSFRQSFGIPFCKYLTMLRLREAVLMRRSGERSITKCAIDSGFGSMRSFYRAFREEFGTTPKEYFANC